jgi:hypothetical protein
MDEVFRKGKIHADSNVDSELAVAADDAELAADAGGAKFR